MNFIAPSSDKRLQACLLYTSDAMNQLHRSHVAVFGLGGVGSYAVEALVRSGVGELTPVSYTHLLAADAEDEVCLPLGKAPLSG